MQNPLRIQYTIKPACMSPVFWVSLKAGCVCLNGTKRILAQVYSKIGRGYVHVVVKTDTPIESKRNSRVHTLLAKTMIITISFIMFYY